MGGMKRLYYYFVTEKFSTIFEINLFLCYFKRYKVITFWLNLFLNNYFLKTDVIKGFTLYTYFKLSNYISFNLVYIKTTFSQLKW